MVRVLSARRFETKAFASAEAALADRDLDWPDCLVVDLNLPALSGLDLVERLRQRGVTAPAVAISANDEARVRDEVRRRGVEHFLAKPFLGSALIALLEQIVGRQQPAGDCCGRSAEGSCTKGKAALPQPAMPRTLA